MKFTWTVKWFARTKSNANCSKARILSRAYFTAARGLCNVHVCAHFFGPFVGSHREPHQNRLKLICNLRRVWPVRYISSSWPAEKERREAGRFHPVIVSTSLPGRRKVRKIEIRIRRVRRFGPITTPGIVPAIAGNSLILITRAIMYRDYGIARTTLNNRHHICIVRVISAM